MLLAMHFYYIGYEIMNVEKIGNIEYLRVMLFGAYPP